MNDTGTVRGLDQETQRINEYSDLAELHQLIDAGQVVPVRDDDTPARLQQVGNAYIVDGMPLNVLVGAEWGPGQREIMEQYWAAGDVPRPADAPEIPEATQAPAVHPAPAAPAGIPDGRQLLVIGAAAALGYLLGKGGN